MRLKGVPWEPIPGREGIAIPNRVNVPVDEDPVIRPMEGYDRDIVPRRVRITR